MGAQPSKIPRRVASTRLGRAGTGVCTTCRCGYVEPDMSVAVVAPRLTTRRRLLAITVGLALVEALFVGLLIPDSLALSPHVSAPEPFGIFHDLRWLFVYHPNALAFVGEGLLLLGFRTLVTAAVVREAWPDEMDRPSWPVLLRRSATFTGVTAVILAPWAALEFGAAVMSLSWLFYVAIPLTLLIALFVHHGSVANDWWKHPPPLRTVGWIAAVFAGLSLASGLIQGAPAGMRPFVIAGVGVFNAWAWHGIVRGVVCRRPVRRPIPLAPIGVAGLVMIAAVGTALGFELSRPTAHPFDIATVSAGGEPVLVVSGFGSRWSGNSQERFGGSFEERRFSYRGLGDEGEALPYDRDDTLAALPELVDEMALQVDDFHRDTGRRVSIVAESQGALLAKTYVAARPDAPVDELILLSPLVRPARVYYPPSGEDGWGVMTGYPLRGLTAMIRGLTPLTMDTDSDLFESVNEHAPLLRTVLACPVAGMEQLIVTPIADAVASADLDTGDLEVIEVADFHGGLLSDGRVRDMVNEELTGGEPHGSETVSLGARAVRAMAAGWQVPELEVSLNPAWEDLEDNRSCASVFEELRTMTAD